MAENKQSVTSKKISRTFNRYQSTNKPIVAKFNKTSQSISTSKFKTIRKLLDEKFGNQQALIARRQISQEGIRNLNQMYVEATQDVLNNKTLDFLVQHSNINVPTFTSIFAGFELARASKADKGRELLNSELKYEDSQRQNDELLSKYQDAYVNDNIKAVEVYGSERKALNDYITNQNINASNNDVAQAYGFETSVDNENRVRERSAISHAQAMQKKEMDFEMDQANKMSTYQHEVNMENLRTTNDWNIANVRGGSNGGNTFIAGSTGASALGQQQSQQQSQQPQQNTVGVLRNDGEVYNPYKLKSFEDVLNNPNFENNESDKRVEPYKPVATSIVNDELFSRLSGPQQVYARTFMDKNIPIRITTDGNMYTDEPTGLTEDGRQKFLAFENNGVVEQYSDYPVQPTNQGESYRLGGTPYQLPVSEETPQEKALREENERIAKEKRERDLRFYTGRGNMEQYNFDINGGN